jgi:CHASE2 domain-containing sensor protein
LISLGVTQIIDGVAEAISAEGGGGAKVVALVVSLLISAVFVIFGWLANQKMLWAYIVGMVLFGLDGLLSLVAQDWIGVIAHGVVLFFLFRGFQAGRDLVSLEKAMAQSAPQTEAAI